MIRGAEVAPHGFHTGKGSKMEMKDDRTPEQHETHTELVIALDCVQSDGPNAAARIIAWESEIHPKICSEARRLGQIARENGLPRVCNLGKEYQTRSGAFLKVYLEPWLQGYDGRDPNRELEEFIKVENHLATLPTSKLNDDWMM